MIVLGATLSAIVAIPAYMLASSGTAVGAITGQSMFVIAA